jgi:Icc-related predicted phosphoesterase
MLGSWISEHQPDVVLTGHVHDPPFKPDGGWADRIGATWVFNPGRQIGPTPTRIELDLDTQRATWTSLLGAEEISLLELSTPSRTVF